MAYVHRIRVRYGECDMQRVVFNAHYMAYCDDAVDTWFRAELAPDGLGFEALGFDSRPNRHLSGAGGESCQKCGVSRILVPS